MSKELQKIQKQIGATFSSKFSVPDSFGNDSQALKAAQEKVALWDRSHWGLIKVCDQERLRFIHNQSTNEINQLKPGQGCETVFVTSTGRNLDLVTVYVAEDSLLLLISPQQREEMMKWLDRFLFPMDQVELIDISEQYAIFTLIGPQSNTLVQNLGIENIGEGKEYTHQLTTIENIKLRLCVGTGLKIPGYTLIVPIQEAANLWQQLINQGTIPLGNDAWEQLRIFQGRPISGQELTEDYNPLETGLWQHISFNKGCYIGQETIARLNTYQGVKQRLWGVISTAPVELGSEVIVAGKRVGKITSSTTTDQGAFSLAYIRSKAGGAGLKVQIGEVEGELIDVPFLTHEYHQSPQEKA
ncbi:MAG: folate-binding protein [Spirulinaceae cyanobacterium]